MSEAEQRQIRAMALLEVEEAKQHLALLQAKLSHWAKLHQKVGHLLAQAGRGDAHFKCVAQETRRDIDGHRSELEAVLNLDALLALDDHLLAASKRLESAEEDRKRLGFS